MQPNADRSSYDFRHALIRDALYADMAPLRRRELHAWVAEAAAGHFGDAFISDHYERAGRPAAAFRHALAAATDAAAISAHREAVTLYRRAQRTAPAAIASSERAELLTSLAAELVATDENAAAAEAYTAAYGILRALGNPSAAAELVPSMVAVQHLLGAGLQDRIRMLREALALIAAEPAPRTELRIHAALSAAYMLDRRLDESIESAERAGAITVDVDEAAIRCNVDATLGSTLLFAGRMDEGWQLLENSIRAATAARLEGEAARGYRMIGASASVLVEYDRGLTWIREGIGYAERTERFNDSHYMTAHLAHVLWAIGDWPAADQEARRALADGRGGITTQVVARYVLGYLGLGRGDWLGSCKFLLEAAELGTRMAELQQVSPAWWGLAENALHCGQFRDAIDWCEKGFVASAGVNDAAYLFPYVLTGTRAHLALDDPTGAGQWLDRAAKPLLGRGIPGSLGAVEHARGLLELHAGQTGKARETLGRATAFWCHQP